MWKPTLASSETWKTDELASRRLRASAGTLAETPLMIERSRVTFPPTDSTAWRASAEPLNPWTITETKWAASSEAAGAAGERPSINRHAKSAATVLHISLIGAAVRARFISARPFYVSQLCSSELHRRETGGPTWPITTKKGVAGND